MKELLNKYIDDHKEETLKFGDTLFHNPELGFKENVTKQLVIDYLEKHNLKVDKTFAMTGLSVTIGSGKPHIGLIAEMDAIPTEGHPCASPVDNAAHACGHSCQMTSMLAALDALNQNINKLKGTVTLFFTPAEEFTDMEYRKQLVKEGKVKYPSGKQEMLYYHLFDDCDCVIHLHASGQYHGHRFSVGSSLLGFIYKKITFIGTTSHASIAPYAGNNALNMCALFLSAVGMLRETFKEEDLVRVHGIVDKGGDTVNSIPGEVIYECYVRSDNPEFLQQLNKQVTKTARCCAQALNGDVKVEDTAGYLPLKQDVNLNKVIYSNMLQFYPEAEIETHEKSTAAGDVGDISAFKPVVQFGYTGFSGNMHGKNMMIIDDNEAYIQPAKIIADSVYDLLNDPTIVDNIVANFKPLMSYQEYLQYLDMK